MMQLAGDEVAIAQLKELAKDHKEYLKYLVNEARSNTDNSTTYRGNDGVKYTLTLTLATGVITVAPAADD